MQTRNASIGQFDESKLKAISTSTLSLMTIQRNEKVTENMKKSQRILDREIEKQKVDGDCSSMLSNTVKELKAMRSKLSCLVINADRSTEVPDLEQDSKHAQKSKPNLRLPSSPQEVKSKADLDYEKYLEIRGKATSDSKECLTVKNENIIKRNIQIASHWNHECSKRRLSLQNNTRLRIKRNNKK